jgi:hypothetical protein
MVAVLAAQNYVESGVSLSLRSYIGKIIRQSRGVRNVPDQQKPALHKTVRISSQKLLV